MPTVTLTAVADMNTTGHGTDTSFQLGDVETGWPSGLFRFDLSSLANVVAVSSATLKLIGNGAGSTGWNYIKGLRCTAAWVEGSSAQNPATVDDGCPDLSIATPIGSAGASLDVTAIVRQWLLNGQANYGLKAQASKNGGTGGYSNICAREDATDSNRPKLTIVYTVNQAPNAPTINDPTSSGYTLNLRPRIKLTGTDPDGDSMTARVRLYSDSGRTVLLQTLTSGSFASGGSTTVTPTADLPTGTIYGRADLNDGYVYGATTDFQFAVAAAPWSDTIPDDAHGLRIAWINDLATVINAARQFRGLATFAFTDGVVSTATNARALHITERRTKLADVLSIVGVVPAWTDAALDSTVDRKGRHVNELRSYCAQT